MALKRKPADAGKSGPLEKAKKAKIAIMSLLTEMDATSTEVPWVLPTQSKKGEATSGKVKMPRAD
jgi:hypothetical protein